MACLFTTAAESDLEAIGDFIALDNPSRAVSFIREIRDRCERIVHAPESHPLVPEYGEAVRRAPFGNYLIFYLVEDRAIVVLHVLHGARNISAADFINPDPSDQGQ